MASGTSQSETTNPLLYLGILVSMIGVIGAIFSLPNMQKYVPFVPKGSKDVNTHASDTLPKIPIPTMTQLPHGMHTYTLTHDTSDNPQFLELTVDPIDPDVNTRQTYAVHIASPYPVTKASLAISTDLHISQIPLKLINGTTENGIWQATWTMPETYYYMYKVTMNAQTDYTLNSKTMNIRE